MLHVIGDGVEPAGFRPRSALSGDAIEERSVPSESTQPTGLLPTYW
jgi:hypothetical protein